MESQSISRTRKDFIKVKFESRGKIYNKIVSCKDMDYKKFVEKLLAGLDLSKQKYYRLCYIDDSKEEINVNPQNAYHHFILAIQQETLYLQETKDQEDHFSKGIQIMDEYQILKEGLNNKNNELIQLQKKYDEGLAVKVRELVKKKTEDLKREIQNYKEAIQIKTRAKLREKLQQIETGAENNHKNTKQTFQHNMGCQSSIQKCSFRKNIIGFRYRCIKCSQDFCQSCSEKEFRAKNGSIHQRTHPMIELKDNRWDSQVSIKIQQKTVSKSKQKQQNVDKMKKVVQETMYRPKQKQQGRQSIKTAVKQKQDEEQLINRFASMLELPIIQARRIRSNHPYLSFQDLIDKVYQR